MQATPLLRATTLVVFSSLGSAGPALADAVTYWNNVTLVAVTAGRPGPPGILDVALVQAAVHDAVQSIEAKYQPYKIAIQGASGSPNAAAAAAAYGRPDWAVPDNPGRHSRRGLECVPHCQSRPGGRPGHRRRPTGGCRNAGVLSRGAKPTSAACRWL